MKTETQSAGLLLKHLTDGERVESLCEGLKESKWMLCSFQHQL